MEIIIVAIVAICVLTWAFRPQNPMIFVDFNGPHTGAQIEAILKRAGITEIHNKGIIYGEIFFTVPEDDYNEAKYVLERNKVRVLR